MDEEELTEEMFQIIKRIADVYENLPAESVAIVMTRKIVGDIEKKSLSDNVDTSLLKEKVSINVIDNLDRDANDSVIFYLTHGLIELMGENFEEIVDLGKNRVQHLLFSNMEEDENGNRKFLEDSDSTDATIIKFSDYKDKLH